MPAKSIASEDDGPNVFLSYSSRDEKEASSIAKMVESVGGKVYLAAKDLRPGQNFTEEMRTALNLAPRLWLLVTPDSVESRWVFAEWGAAWVQHKQVVPILLRCNPKELPEQLKGYQWIDFHNVRELVRESFPSSHRSEIGMEAVLRMAGNFIDERDDVVAALAAGRAFLMMKQYDYAHEVFEHVRNAVEKTHADYYIILGNLAYSLIGKKRYREAVTRLLEVRKMTGGKKFFVWHTMALAYAYRRLKQERKYREWLKKSKDFANYEELKDWFQQLYPEIRKDL